MGRSGAKGLGKRDLWGIQKYSVVSKKIEGVCMGMGK